MKKKTIRFILTYLITVLIGTLSHFAFTTFNFDNFLLIDDNFFIKSDVLDILLSFILVSFQSISIQFIPLLIYSDVLYVISS